jgi:hypothetical protein
MFFRQKEKAREEEKKLSDKILGDVFDSGHVAPPTEQPESYT